MRDLTLALTDGASRQAKADCQYDLCYDRDKIAMKNEICVGA